MPNQESVRAQWIIQKMFFSSKLQNSKVFATPTYANTTLGSENPIAQSSEQAHSVNSVINTVSGSPSLPIHVMVTGSVGCGKTVTMLNILSSLSFTKPESSDSLLYQSSELTQTIGSQSKSHTMRYKHYPITCLTQPNSIQIALESMLDRRIGNTFGPANDETIVLFFDDLHMSSQNEWGDRPVSELLRQYLDIHGFYSLNKPGELFRVEDLLLLCALRVSENHSSSLQSSTLPPIRLLSRFFAIHLPTPQTQQLEHHFHVVNREFFSIDRGFDAEVCRMSRRLPTLLKLIWSDIQLQIRSTPMKPHYSFTVREVFAIIYGMQKATPETVPSSSEMLLLWVHECERVVSDRLIDLADKHRFRWIVQHNITKYIGQEWSEVASQYWNEEVEDVILQSYESDGDENDKSAEISSSESKLGPNDDNSLPDTIHTLLFADFLHSNINTNGSRMRESNRVGNPTIQATSSVRTSTLAHVVDGMSSNSSNQHELVESTKEPKVYELVRSWKLLKRRITQEVSCHNSQCHTNDFLDIVLFHDAIIHLVRICRILGIPRCNALLIGVGGSGRRSLARLAAFMCAYRVGRLQSAEESGLSGFFDDLKLLIKQAGYLDQKIVLIVGETELQALAAFTQSTRNSSNRVIGAKNGQTSINSYFPNYTEQSVTDVLLDTLQVLVATGQVHALFSPEEVEGMLSDMRQDMKVAWPNEFDTTDAVHNFFLAKVRNNLRLIMCLSSLPASLAQYHSQFPGIFSGSCMDWYTPWPQDALQAVAKHLIVDMLPEMCVKGDNTEQSEETQGNAQNQWNGHDIWSPIVRFQATRIPLFMANIHITVNVLCQAITNKELGMRKSVHVTPKTYSTYLQYFNSLFADKSEKLTTQLRTLHLGLTRLIDAEKAVDSMSHILDQKRQELALKGHELTMLLDTIRSNTQIAEHQKSKVMQDKKRLEIEAEEVDEQLEIVKNDLAKAEPALKLALEELQHITPSDIATLKKLSKPPNLIKRILDCVLILRHLPILSVKVFH